MLGINRNSKKPVVEPVVVEPAEDKPVESNDE